MGGALRRAARRNSSQCPRSTEGSSAGHRWWRRNSWRFGVQPSPQLESEIAMQTLVLVLHMLAAGGIVVLVLLQHGKGADMGVAFGRGSRGSLLVCGGGAA